MVSVSSSNFVPIFVFFKFCDVTEPLQKLGDILYFDEPGLSVITVAKYDTTVSLFILNN